MLKTAPGAPPNSTVEVAPAQLTLPVEHAVHGTLDHECASETGTVRGELGDSLRAIARREAVSLGELLLATVAVLLQRYCQPDNLRIIACFGESQTREFHLSGGASTLQDLRLVLSDELNFMGVLSRVREAISVAPVYERAFETTGESFQSPDAAPSDPKPQVLFFFQSENESSPGHDESALGSFEVAEHFPNEPVLAFEFVSSGEKLHSGVCYSKKLFNPDTIRRMLGHLETLLDGICHSPASLISELPMLPEWERRRLLNEWNDTARDYPKDKTLFELFEEQVALAPEAEALVCGHTRLRYSDLLFRAMKVADRLRSMGVGVETLTGVCLGRSWEMICGILGTLQAGGAYVPLDPAYPQERLAFMLRDANVQVLLTERRLLDRLPSTDAQVLCIEDINCAANESGTQLDVSGVNCANRSSKPPPSGAARPRLEQKTSNGGSSSSASGHRLAYVIYTSGSTGQPKGVALEHRGAVALVSWASQQFTAKELSGVLASTSICFDVSIFELFVPLCCGGRIILADNALALPTLPAADEVTLVVTVPSAMRELMRMNGIPSSVRAANLAGEPLTAQLADQIYRETSIQKVYDLYGPTETTVYSTWALRNPGGPAIIGHPLSNEQAYVLDPKRQLVPIGLPGELYIGGDGLARGYLHQPDLTRERFVPHPFKKGCRLYKTGDRVRWRSDGNLEYLGRFDHQVKIRGFRIEPAEIEAVLKSNLAVQEAVVVARPDARGDKRLVAYVVAGAAKETLPWCDQRALTAELRRSVRSRLPEYMVPSLAMCLEAMPRTPGGKLDRNALPEPDWDALQDDAGFESPRNQVEEQLAAIWAEVLGLKRVGTSDNFFELGGHSLSVIQVNSRIRETFNIELPVSALFDAPTVKALAEGVASTRWPSLPAEVSPLRPVPRNTPLPASFVQERLWFLHQLQPEVPAYNVPAALCLRGKLDYGALRRACNALVRRHETLRTTFQYIDGELMQVIAPVLELELELFELHSPPLESAGVARARGKSAQVQEWLNQQSQRPFDLARGPLVRVGLARLAEDEHVFVAIMHHTIADGWSLDIFFRELSAFYDLAAGGESGLPDLPVQYADFAHWQRHHLSSPVLERQLGYWKEKLAGAPNALDLPVDHPEDKEPSRKAGAFRIDLSEELRRAINEFSQREGCTSFMVLMSALAITLHRWSGQDDLVLGTVMGGRTRRECENLIGCFMNFLPVRTKFAGLKRGRDVLAQTRTTLLEAQTRQDCPFEKIVEALNPDRRLNHNPLYNVALVFQNFTGEGFCSEKLASSGLKPELEAALLDLRFEAEDSGKSLSLKCEYRTELFEPETGEQLLLAFQETLKSLTCSPERLLANFELPTPLVNRVAASRARNSRLTIAISATFTAEPLLEPLKEWINELELPAGLEFAPYNQVFQQLLTPSSLLGRNASGLNVVLIRLEDWQKGNAVPEQVATELIGAIKAATVRTSTPFLVCVCPPSEAAATDPGRTRAFARIEKNLEAEFAALSGVYWLGTTTLAAMYPVKEYYDKSGDELGHVPYTPVFFVALATVIARHFHALNRPSYKVIVLDCDQTLWSGVCGEDGPKGIRLDPCRKALQEFMRAQHDAGMLLCLCSKNQEADVQEVFSQRLEMPLRREHFAAWRLNWRPKSENLKSLAAELQLGLESFVLVDDNPLECAEVEANCPEVLTLQLPENVEQIPQFLKHCWVFDHLKLTAEDRRRNQLYRQERKREMLKAESSSLADFLIGLDLKLQIEPLTRAALPRAAQLLQRTNQFNCTTRRRSEIELQLLLQNCEGRIVSVSDRFGDYGVCGLMLYKARDRSLDVDTFLLSCRALGRGVEHQMLANLGSNARERRLDWVDVHFIPSPRNQPALDFLESVGRVFKQPLNGGFVFRFPAGVAADIEFNPNQVRPGPPTSQKNRVPSFQRQSIQLDTRLGGFTGPPAKKFNRCRAIALECCDPLKIHERLEKRTVSRGTRRTEYLAPRTPLERQCCELWQKVLRVEQVGIRDNFFDLGGHSLLAVRLFADLEKVTGRKLPLVTLFQAPTVEQLAKALRQKTGGSSASLLVPIKPHGTKPPLFLVHGAGGDVLWGYANLAGHLAPDQPLYGIKSRGQAGLEELTSVKEMAQCYLKEVRAFQPEGPYFLGGYCFGGNVAYEMARQLVAQGVEVALVVLFDSAPSNAGYENPSWRRPQFWCRFSRNVCYWLDDFRTLPFRNQRRFIFRKARALGRKVKRSLLSPKDPHEVDVEEVIDPVYFPESELQLWRIHLRALTEHVDGPYSGCVVLLRTRGQPLLCSFDEDFCWSRLARGGLTVKRIPGSHENVFMEPNVKFLALELENSLAEPGNPKATSALT